MTPHLVIGIISIQALVLLIRPVTNVKGNVAIG